MKNTCFVLVLFGLMGCNQSASTTPPPEKAQICVACHGQNGKTETPIYPNLAGQNKAYLEMSLRSYRDQSRKGGQADAMYGIAATLTDSDIKQLAAYFSEQSH